MASSHAIEWRSQPSFAASVVVYWPGATGCEIVPSSTEIEPDGVPENENVSVPPFMIFFTITRPCSAGTSSFVSVQVFDSPAPTETLPCASQSPEYVSE